MGVFRKKNIMSLYCYFQFIFNVTGFLLTLLVLYLFLFLTLKIVFKHRYHNYFISKFSAHVITDIKTLRAV